nr:RecName: Full=Triosephosphate isomerase, cytosolic; Short=TIM; Short=Triose-phosphate isomerase [Nicotiana plumbaginifolia]
GRTFFVGGNW